MDEKVRGKSAESELTRVGVSLNIDLATRERAEELLQEVQASPELQVDFYY
jgi:hypothetical protein